MSVWSPLFWDAAGCPAHEYWEEKVVCWAGLIFVISRFQRKQESPHLKPYLTLSLEVSLELGHFHFCGGSLVREDVVTSSGHCMVNLEQ